MNRALSGHAPGALPQHYLGVWRRIHLGSPQGDDDTSLVLWLQGPRWHADLRIPAARPGCAGARGVADCSRAQLLDLLRQEGFAGITVVRDDICEWQRELDYRPTGQRDIARIAFARDGASIDEYGLEADYSERWQRQGDGGAAPPPWRDAEGLWLRQGAHFMRVRERRLDAAQAARAWADLAGTDLATLRALADFEVSFGSVEPPRLLHSTLPWLEGRALRLPPQLL